jgi:outer membrane protein
MYSKSTNENGFTLLNQLQGFNYGITATLPLFDGFNINRQIKNAKLQTIYSDISLEYANLNVRSELYNAYTVFTNNYELLLIEEENIGYAREVLMIANERYRIGVSNSTEQLEAQRTFEEAMKRLADARYFAKVSETRLRKLNGELVR